MEPYVSIVSVNDLSLSDDVIPLALQEDATTCQQTKGVMIPQNAGTVIVVEWTVSGALDIDETSLVYGKWSDLLDGAISCMMQPDIDKLSLLTLALDQSAINGMGYFSRNGPYPMESQSGSTLSTMPLATFSYTLTLSASLPNILSNVKKVQPSTLSGRG